MSKNEKNYSDKDLNGMSNGELARLGTELDDVTVAYRKERFPIDNDPAEKRASRAVYCPPSRSWASISPGRGSIRAWVMRG